MTKTDYHPIYYCDFRASDGSTILASQPVRFVAEPSHFVTVDSTAFKKVWESGNQVVYVQVSTFNATSQVSLYG